MVFDRFIKMCEFKIDTSILYEERNIFIKKTLLNLKESDIYNFFELDSFDKKRDEIIASRYLTEYIVSYYFGDNYYNFLTNFYQMTGYLSSNKKGLINAAHLKLYQDFIDIKKREKIS